MFVLHTHWQPPRPPNEPGGILFWAETSDAEPPPRHRGTLPKKHKPTDHPFNLAPDTLRETIGSGTPLYDARESSALLLLPTTLLLWLHEPRLPQLHLPHLISADRTYPVISALGVHGMFFGVGWLCHAGAQHWRTLIRHWQPLLLAAPLLRLGAAALQLRGDPPTLLVHALMASYWWAIVLGCLGLLTALVKVPSARLGYLADASYWFYLSHLLFMGEMQYLVNGRGWPVAAQYLAVVSGTLGLCGLTYHFIVRPFQGIDLRYDRSQC